MVIFNGCGAKGDETDDNVDNKDSFKFIQSIKDDCGDDDDDDDDDDDYDDDNDDDDDDDDDDAYEGCYKETLRNREMFISPGAYTPELLTPTMCRTKCGLYHWKYAGVAHGKFCFCGNDLPAVQEADSNCNMPCAGDGAETCGSTTHVGVYVSSVSIAGLQVTSDVNTVQAVPATVTLTLGVEKGK
ncbi:WSC domain-containing protein 1 [Elysia marginata]|uniref:WSC domain-containing protein 1 n=1 Tax=Elysia marginata TaxID=1093978 RepID=A0AAV4IDT6_9GAST|nr:WSC domain-containing protein 1 [Elysia marginata]